MLNPVDPQQDRYLHENAKHFSSLIQSHHSQRIFKLETADSALEPNARLEQAYFSFPKSLATIVSNVKKSDCNKHPLVVYSHHLRHSQDAGK